MLQVSDRTQGVSNHKLRQQGAVPVVYFHKHEPSVSLEVKLSDLEKVLKSHESVLELSNGKMAVVKEVQRDPVSQKLLHVSFQGVVKGEKFTQAVKVILTHDEKCPWKNDGLQLRQTLDSVTVETTPSKLPDNFTVDVSNLTEGEHLKVKDIQVPEGVEVLDDPEQEVAAVAHVKVAAEPEEETTSEGGEEQDVTEEAEVASEEESTSKE